jgi:Family of unknown function (DUF6448)
MDTRTAITLVSAALAVAWSGTVLSHCDTLDGPVVMAARKALDSGDINLVLVWVQKSDEHQLRTAFEKAVVVRKAGRAAMDLADTWFFETLVRLHRAGEGAPYTGLKASGLFDPPVAAADKAIQTGRLDDVAKLVSQRMHDGLQRNFSAVMSKKQYEPRDVQAGRAYSSAYVEYIHYVERLYDAAETLAPKAMAAPIHKH